MEGHRRFDLVRWETAAETINAYLDFERANIAHFREYRFEEGKDGYYPIPGEFVDRSRVNGTPTIVQPYVK
jgi:hypothetical protein